jgi:tRNA threonylcarbamoyladenosine biosynthesis protein TsaB
VGLARGGEMIALRESSEGRDHAARVAVYTNEAMGEAGVRFADLSAVAVSMGPGSYTGLRIGVSFAKGLCYGLGIPLIGVGSLDSLCEMATMDGSGDNPPPAFRLPMIDARRMEVYGQVFDAAGRALTEPEAWIIDEGSLAEWRDRGEVCIFGSGADKCREALPWARFVEVQPSARGMVRLAAEAFEAGRHEDVAYFEPFYLKDFVITTSRKKLL